jgi:hypothetical protein
MILYKKLLYTCEFCQAHCVELIIRVHTKFTLPFLDIPTSFYEFWNFETISRIYLNKKEKKKFKQCMGRICPEATVHRPGGLPCAVGWASAWWPGLATEWPTCHAVARAGTWWHSVV